MTLRTPREHLAAQNDAMGLHIAARRIRRGARLQAGERIAIRAIEAAQIEALGPRLKRDERVDS